ncbi:MULTISPECIES: DUF2860 domain-containing protein [Vibrio]|uniref:DUF2860 domain-containing protein n=1 Tax=Vibrio chanodichtyis TaxID=3027932 RepID=A0ABT5UZ01_9VIBR|nr:MULTISPECIES: DUF2860 domain-containing protein [Vibrio]MDE1514640.1 DUF2860 domain-containing protein [Vibrio chanodichtyis]
MKPLYTYLSVLPLLSLSLTAQASSDRNQPGWDFTLSLNSFYARTQSQMNTNDDNALTPNLQQSGHTTSKMRFMPLGNVQYTFASGKTQFFAGQSSDQVIEGQLQAELGITHKFDQLGQITLAYFPALPGVNETWRDPYLTQAARSTTDITAQGGRIAYTAPFALPLTLRYAYLDYQVDKEQSASEDKWSAIDRGLLNRNSIYQQMSAEVSLPISRAWSLVPQVSYTKRDAEGDAFDFNALDYQLSLNHFFGQQALFMTLSYGQEDYQTEHPIFSATRDAQRWSAFALYAYRAPFGWKNVSLNAMAGIRETNDVINFFDQKSTFLSTGIAFNF